MPKKSLSPESLEEIASRFRALGEPLRLRLLHHLLAGEQSVGALAEALESSAANVSKHVAILVDAGFVARRKEGTTVYCSVADQVVPKLCELMCDRVVAEAERTLARVRPRLG
jgi:DNA-binding transcriptional ArsR family regulator